MTLKKPFIEVLIYILIAGFVLFIAFSYTKQQFGYERYETATLSYDKAKVIKITEQELEADQSGEHLIGYQKLTVRFLNGREKGKQVEVDNYLTATHNIMAKSGKTLVICSDIPENAESYYTVYNYYRSPLIWVVVVLFLVLVAVIGGKKGIRSGLSLLFTLFMIVCYLLPALYKGESPVVAAVVSTAISAAGALYLLNGLSFKTLVDIISTTIGVMIAGILFFLLSGILNISGYQTEEAESLILIAQSTGLHIKGILFAGVLTASLGAVMDVGVSIGAALLEIVRLNPKITGRELFFSGMNIGKDMIGTMTNTLILAFAGSSLMTLLIFISYGIGYQQLMSSDYLAVELAEAIAGSAAVVIMVPVASLVCALGYPQIKQKNGGKS